ncbi:hypothetical protein QYS48_33205 [Marivirga arenosa]|uniref:Secreted protein n=1 Tax=Marivirga arenosa TaxID=3059076 RepID=A0AA51RAB9_9BACT|nr:hypothetical protein [Marivirga sp. ABR2-2]WMN06653.1 hypothetical protein QYS48_33205 [Marivirga sp. ABR2-2]
MKKLLLFVFILSSSAFTQAQSYSQGYILGEGDAEETFYLFYEQRSTCTSSGDPGPLGSPINNRNCWYTYNEQGFVNFWQGYIANVENNYCSQRGTSSEQYAKGVVDGYKTKMTLMSMQYGTNYYGGGAGLISCN